MEPNVKAGFDKILRRLDAFDARCEQRFAESETVREQRASAMEGRFTDMEQRGTSTNLEQRDASTEIRLGKLETFCSG
jgi:hypothetical protein